MENQNQKLERPEEEIYANYLCPICGLEMKRDTCVFLNHTRRHLYDLLLKLHPNWRANGDGYKECQKYLDKQFRH